MAADGRVLSLALLLLLCSEGAALPRLPSLAQLHRQPVAPLAATGRWTRVADPWDRDDTDPWKLRGGSDELGQQAELRSWRRQMRNDVVAFAGPALSTVLADPLMSVVDALCVGRFCTTLQLASLGPALAVFNFVNYFFFFLNAATTVQVTRALACDDESGATKTLANAVIIAGSCGVALSVFLIVFAESLVGATGCVPELLPVAARYLRVRAMGQPVVLMSMVVQAGLLAQRDVITPLQVVATACVLNIAGDILLVPRLGATGAAWATLASQLVALPLMLRLASVRKRLPVQLRRPRLDDLGPFFTTAAPLFFFEMGLSTCYMFIQSVSTQFSVASAAAFQALWSPVSVLCFFTYPLKQAAQVFLPQMLSGSSKENTIAGSPKSKEFLKVLASLSTILGVALASFGVLLAQTPSLFTSDATLFPIIRGFAPYVAAVLPILGAAQVMEGVLLGTGDLSFLSRSQLLNVLATAAALWLTKSAGMGINLTWLLFIVFAGSRAMQAFARVFVTRRPWREDSDVCATI